MRSPRPIPRWTGRGARPGKAGPQPRDRNRGLGTPNGSTPAAIELVSALARHRVEAVTPGCILLPHAPHKTRPNFETARKGDVDMSRSPLFHRFSRTVRIAWFAERNRISTREALEHVAEVQGEAERRRTRREFLGDVTRIAAAGALASVAGPLDSASAKPRSGKGSTPTIAIV